jgi:uncharacterized membrane protein
MTQDDPLIAEFLTQVAVAGDGLARARREELLGDLREHIDVELATLEGPATEAQIRTILDRLGDPEDIAAAAVEQDTGSLAARPVAAPRPVHWRRAAMIAAAVALVLALCGLGLFVAFAPGRGSSPEPIPAASLHLLGAGSPGTPLIDAMQGEID